MKFDTATTLLLNELWGTTGQGTQYYGGNPRNVNPTKVRDTNIYKPVDIKVGQTAAGEVAITGTKEEMAIEEAGMTAARAMLLFATALKNDPIIKNYLKKILDSKKDNLSPRELAELHGLESFLRNRKHLKHERYGGFDMQRDFERYTELIRKRNTTGGTEQDKVELDALNKEIDMICFALKNPDGTINRDSPGCVSATQNQRSKIAEIQRRLNKTIDKEEIKRIKDIVKRRLDTISSKELKPHLDDVVEYIFDFIADDPSVLDDLDLPKYMLSNPDDTPGEPKPTSQPVGPKTPPSGSGSAKEGPSIKTAPSIKATLVDSLPQIKELAMKLLGTIPNVLASTSKAIAALPDKIRNAATKQTQHLLKNVNPDNVIELVFSGKKDGVPVYAPAQADEETLPTFKVFFNRR